MDLFTFMFFTCTWWILQIPFPHTRSSGRLEEFESRHSCVTVKCLLPMGHRDPALSEYPSTLIYLWNRNEKSTNDLKLQYEHDKLTILSWFHMSKFGSRMIELLYWGHFAFVSDLYSHIQYAAILVHQQNAMVVSYIELNGVHVPKCCIYNKYKGGTCTGSV